jgi:ketosteroid isomerase-like protein
VAGRIEETKQRYQQFDQGDVQAALENWADDVVWEGSNSTELPGGGVHQGKEKVTQVLGEAVGAWDEFKLTPDEYFEEGDTVVVLAHTDVRKGDKSAKSPVVHIFRWEGDQVKRFQVLGDTYQLAELLGKV